LNYRNPSAADGLITSCEETYNDLISFQGNGYAILDDLYQPHMSYEFYLEFRTTECDGLLLYSSSYYLKDHTALEISEGKLRFIFDNGDHELHGVVEYVPTHSSELCDGNWHTVKVMKNGIEGRLEVDQQIPIQFTLSNGNLNSVDANSPLYAGGVPNDIIVRCTVKSNTFSGCMRKIQLDQKPIQVSNIVASSNAQFYTCHV
jgi:hypothetical protein